MEVSIKGQLVCLAFSFAFGIVSSALYGVFRVTSLLVGFAGSNGKGRTARAISGVLQFVYDVTYCIIVTVGFQLLLYVFDFGRFRFVYLLSSALGFWAYSKTLGRLFDKASEKVVSLIRKTVSTAIRYLLLPIKFIFVFIWAKVKQAINLIIIKPYVNFVRRRYKRKTRFIIDSKLSDLVKF